MLAQGNIFTVTKSDRISSFNNHLQTTKLIFSLVPKKAAKPNKKAAAKLEKAAPFKEKAAAFKGKAAPNRVFIAPNKVFIAPFRLFLKNKRECNLNCVRCG